MRVLWLTNTMLPAVSEAIGEKEHFGGGWLVGLSEMLLKNDDTMLAVCTPGSVAEIKHGKEKALEYYIIPCKDIKQYDPNLKVIFQRIISHFNPDVIHAFGTEYPDILSLLETDNERKTVISITGMVTFCAKHYYGGICGNIRKKYYIRRLLSVIKSFVISSVEQEDMTYRGEYERAAIKRARHIIGRTTWDRANVKQINPQAEYHLCNETLRPSFYSGVWEYEKCEKHSIFAGNGGYPIKGLHMLFEAMPLIKNAYPDTKLYIAGANMMFRPSRLRQSMLHYMSTYSGYLYKLAKRLQIIENICFTGLLDEKAMKQRYLDSNVFVLPSCIENSPNSLGEAMLLGVPCVAAGVGGVQDMLKDKEEGYIYPFDEPYMLAYYVCEIFKHPERAAHMGLHAREHAMITHDAVKNNETLIQLYKEVSGIL